MIVSDPPDDPDGDRSGWVPPTVPDHLGLPQEAGPERDSAIDNLFGDGGAYLDFRDPNRPDRYLPLDDPADRFPVTLELFEYDEVREQLAQERREWPAESAVHRWADRCDQVLDENESYQLAWNVWADRLISGTWTAVTT